MDRKSNLVKESLPSNIRSSRTLKAILVHVLHGPKWHSMTYHLLFRIGDVGDRERREGVWRRLLYREILRYIPLEFLCRRRMSTVTVGDVFVHRTLSDVSCRSRPDENGGDFVFDVLGVLLFGLLEERLHLRLSDVFGDIDGIIVGFVGEYVRDPSTIVFGQSRRVDFDIHCLVK